MSSERRIALVRRPCTRLAEGLVTHIGRSPVDVDLARRQHAAYCQALEGAGWAVREVEPAEEHPDSVFVEDALVVCERTAVLTRPGAPGRRGEVPGAERAARGLGLDLVRITAPATLEGGDVLQVGTDVYVGVGGRTNEAGVAQLRALLQPLGRTVVPVPLKGVLHLKSAVTALPDGSFVALPGLFDTAAMPPVGEVAEEAGCHVVVLGAEAVLISAAAVRTARLLGERGLQVHAVDISEFEKLEGCVTCLSVLVP